jgi:hypothetical protein
VHVGRGLTAFAAEFGTAPGPSPIISQHSRSGRPRSDCPAGQR